MISRLRRAAENRARIFSHVDWFIFMSALAISLLGLVTMRSFSAENFFFDKQLVWICIAVAAFFAARIPEYGFSLTLISLFGAIVKGAQNRFNLGFLWVQPSAPAKLLLVMCSRNTLR